MGIVTIVVLLADDIRLIAFHKQDDVFFSIIFLICFILFLAEFIITCMITKNYRFSFFFYLDLIATLSLLQDIVWFYDFFLGLISIDYSVDPLASSVPLFIHHGPSMHTSKRDRSENSGNITQTGRIGTRASRIVRLVRLIRLVKLTSIANLFISNSNQNYEQEDILHQHHDKQIQNYQSRMESDREKRIEASTLGKTLTNRNSHKIIVAVLIILFVLPALHFEISDSSTKKSLEKLFYSGLSSLNCNVPANPPNYLCDYQNSRIDVTKEGWNLFLWSLIIGAQDYTYIGHASESKVLWLHINDYNNNNKIHDITSVTSPFNSLETWNSSIPCSGITVSEDCPWRASEMVMFVYEPPIRYEESDSLSIMCRIQIRERSEEAALYNIYLTIFIMVLLVLSNYLFTRDINLYVLYPIESISAIVQQLSSTKNYYNSSPNGPDNDMSASAGSSIEKEEANGLDDIYYQELVNNLELNNPQSFQPRKKKKNNGELETATLQTTIIKIGALLKLAFGKAGSGVVAEYLSNKQEVQSGYPFSGNNEEFNKSINRATRVKAIFCFIGIAEIAKVTECLSEESIVFINKIAYIMNCCCTQYDGNMNKNNGSSFLIVYKIHDDEQLRKLQKSLETSAEKRRALQNKKSSPPSTSPPLSPGSNNNALASNLSNNNFAENKRFSVINSLLNSGIQNSAVNNPIPFTAITGPGPYPNNESRKMSSSAYSTSYYGYMHQNSSVLGNAGGEKGAKEAKEKSTEALMTFECEFEDLNKEFERKKDEILEGTKSIFDGAILTIFKIIAEIKRANDLSAYEKHPKIFPAFEQSFSIKFDIGVHCGYAMEGAIGSYHKIDASYLGLPVNIANRLCAANAFYGTNVILSEDVAKGLSMEISENLRPLDVVSLSNISHEPMALYTFFLADNPNVPAQNTEIGDVIPVANIANETLSNKNNLWSFLFDADVKELTKIDSTNYLEVANSWRQVMSDFSSGDWRNAKENIIKFRNLLPDDIPSQYLEMFLDANDCLPPSSWNGVRILSKY